MNEIASWVTSWDERMAEWTHIGPASDLRCQDILRCYRGSGRTAIDKGACPEPYVGDPLSRRLAGVALHLNPGAGAPAQTWPDGPLVAAVREHGYHAVYRRWAIPPGTAKWWARSGRWLKRLARAPGCDDLDVFGIDVFPWHSPGFGSLALDREGVQWIDENVLRSAAAVAPSTAFGALTLQAYGAPAVLAVGKVFATLLQQLEFEVLDETGKSDGPARFAWPDRADGTPTSRTVRVHRSREHGLVVLQTSAPGGNTLPRPAFDPILREMLRGAA